MNYTFNGTTIRGAAGESWESARDVCYDWEFDSRDIKTKTCMFGMLQMTLFVLLK
jgi:hypothetical protein